MLGIFTFVSKAVSPWHDIRVPEDNLGGNVLLRIISSKARQTHVGLLALCSAKLWVFPGMEISQLFQQANLFQSWTTYYSPEMTATRAVHSSPKLSSCALYRSPALRIQPPASSQDSGGSSSRRLTLKHHHQAGISGGTEEEVPVHGGPLKVCMGWMCGVWFPPSLPALELVELTQNQGLCVSHCHWGSVFGSHWETSAYSQFHHQISVFLKFPVTLLPFRSAYSISREWKAANEHYYESSKGKVGCCQGFRANLPWLHP